MERIIITFTQDGTFRGASVTDFAGQPKPLDEAALNALFPAINASSLARVTTLEAEKATLEAAKESATTDIEAANARIAELEALPKPLGVDQLTIMERLGDQKAEILEGLISQLPIQARMSWQFSPQIRLEHPLIAATKPTLMQALSLTEQELINILTP
jgi:hypothetical protein